MLVTLLLWDAVPVLQTARSLRISGVHCAEPTFPLMVFRRVITVRTCALYASRADGEVKKASWFVLPPVYANLCACAPLPHTPEKPGRCVAARPGVH